MGVILQGILGGFSGKVGPVVGGKWKEIDYMRSYVIPSNPNTPAQQAVREKFSALVARGREILSVILNPFWDPFLSSMSGFNAWISQNYSLSDADGILNENAVMSKGTLTATPLLTAEYFTATGAVAVTFSTILNGNQTDLDKVVLVALDETNQTLYSEVLTNTRADGGGETIIRTGLTATAVIVYMFLFQGTGSELKISDSVSMVCTAG